MKHIQTILCLSVMCLLTASMCSEEDEPIVETPDVVIPNQPGAKLEFIIDSLALFTENVEGTGTAESPATVMDGDTLRVSIGGKVLYIPDEGREFTFYPKAAMTMFATHDTVVAKNIRELTKLNLQADTRTEVTGSNPLKHSTQQVYTLGGGQEVCFDFVYDVWSHTDSVTNTTLQMPYLKMDNATPGHASPNEGKEAVTLRTVSATRASVTDSTLYRVEALFTVEATDVNAFRSDTAAIVKRSIAVAISYLGIVEEVTELEGALSCTYRYNEDASTAEPAPAYALEVGKTTTLTLSQQSSFLKKGDTLRTKGLTAGITVRVAETDKEMGSEAELRELTKGEYLLDSVAGNPMQTTSAQTLEFGGLTFELATHHESYIDADDNEMPYLQIGQWQDLEATTTLVSRTKNTRATKGEIIDTLLYELDIHLSIPVQRMNCDEVQTEMLTFNLKTQATVIEHVKVTYRKDQVFLEGHDNLLPTSQCQVFRDRHYSDGHVETDEFCDLTWTLMEKSVGLSSGNSVILPSDTIVKYSPDFMVRYGYLNKYSNETDHVHRYARSSTQIPDIEHIAIDTTIITQHTDCYNELYIHQLTYEPYNPDNPIDGWYMYKPGNIYNNHLYYTKNNEKIPFRYYFIIYHYYDRFLCIDDTIIGFEEFRPKLENTIGFIDYEGSETRGPGKIYQNIVKGEYLGHEVYLEVTDTIYTPKEQ